LPANSSEALHCFRERLRWQASSYGRGSCRVNSAIEQAQKSPSRRGFSYSVSANPHQVIWMMVCMMVLWVEMVLAFA